MKSKATRIVSIVILLFFSTSSLSGEIHDISEKGTSAELEIYLINNLNEINSFDKYGWTALHRAIESGNVKKILALLVAGADVTIKTKNGWNAMRVAEKTEKTPEFREAYGFVTDKAYERVKKHNTIEKYQWFIDKYPESGLQSDAIESIYMLVKKENAIEKYQRFIDNYPKSELKADAIESIYALVKKENVIDKYQWFIEAYPDSKQKQDAIEPIRKLVFNMNDALLKQWFYNSYPYINSIGMKFKYIPAGSFYMGSCRLSGADQEINKKRGFLGLSLKKVEGICPSGSRADSKASEYEIPQHKVNITKSFQMGVYEVTVGQFKEFIINAGKDHLLTDDFMLFNNNGNSSAVKYVSWHDAQDFIEWINNKEGGGDHYRLPTEAEWEYAARAGTTGNYSWGKGNMTDDAKNYAWFDYDPGFMDRLFGDRRTNFDVGSKASNPWGLYDMHGNVSEWVMDDFDGSFYESSPENDPRNTSKSRMIYASNEGLIGAIKRGIAFISGNSSDLSQSVFEKRVVRGGSWYSKVEELRSAARNGYKPNERNLYVGFRLLREP